MTQYSFIQMKKDLKEGKEFIFTMPEDYDDRRSAECTYSKSKFNIWFNGKLFTYKTFQGFHNKLAQLIKDWRLNIVESPVPNHSQQK